MTRPAINVATVLNTSTSRYENESHVLRPLCCPCSRPFLLHRSAVLQPSVFSSADLRRNQGPLVEGACGSAVDWCVQHRAENRAVQSAVGCSYTSGAHIVTAVTTPFAPRGASHGPASRRTLASSLPAAEPARDRR